MSNKRVAINGFGRIGRLTLRAFLEAGRKDLDFVAINVNNNEADKLPKMIERAKEKGFNFDYLYDPSQQIGKQLGARVTPEFYVFNKDRELVYHGAMDENNNAAKAGTNFLAEAVQATLEGGEVKTAETRARGCGVQYESR